MGDETKFHLVNWHRVCTPIKAGGLGVRLEVFSGVQCFVEIGD